MLIVERDGVLTTKLRAAELKARELGLMPEWTQGTQEVTLPEHIKHKGFDTGVAPQSLVRFLVDIIGRNAKVRDASARGTMASRPCPAGWHGETQTGHAARRVERSPAWWLRSCPVPPVGVLPGC